MFAKEPQPGRVKTRLAASIGAEPAAELAWALLRDTCSLARAAADALGARLELHHAPSDPGPELRELAAAFGCELVAQGPGSLGERLAAGLRPDHSARIALGSDAPDLPRDLLDQAFLALEEPRTAIAAPAPDGGYVLLGLADGASASALADPAIRWSSATTLSDTCSALLRTGSEVARLGGWSDVDELADLEALEERLRSDEGSAPATRAWLLDWRSRSPKTP